MKKKREGRDDCAAHLTDSRGRREEPDVNKAGVKSKPSKNPPPSPANVSYPLTTLPPHTRSVSLSAVTFVIRATLSIGGRPPPPLPPSIGRVKFNEHLLWNDMNNVYITGSFKAPVVHLSAGMDGSHKRGNRGRKLKRPRGKKKKEEKKKEGEGRRRATW